jgi:hypothetical protein
VGLGLRLIHNFYGVRWVWGRFSPISRPRWDSRFLTINKVGEAEFVNAPPPSGPHVEELLLLHGAAACGRRGEVRANRQTAARATTRLNVQCSGRADTDMLIGLD